MRIGIVTDHGGFALKEEIVERLQETSNEVVDLGAHTLNPEDDYPDFVIPLAKAVAEGKVDSYEHPLHGRPHCRCGSSLGSCADISVRRIQPSRAASAASR